MSPAILESISERNQRSLHSVDSARMLNVNNADPVLRYSPKWQKLRKMTVEPLMTDGVF